MGEVIFGKELQDAYDYVEEALQRKKSCRNSDEFLVWYIKKYLLSDGSPDQGPESGKDLNQYQQFKSQPGMRTLIRKRAEIQNDEGRFPPTDPEVAEQRKIKEEVIWQEYSSDAEILEKFRTSDTAFFSKNEE